MTVAQSLLAFIAAASLLTITPGVDTAMVLRWATTGGPRPAALALIGIAAGCLIWGAAVSLGMGALLAASALGFTLVKFAGAAYLVWLGLHLFLHPRESFAPSLTGTKGRGSLPAFRQGFLSNVLNPKMGVFYVTFLPQFVPEGVNVATFALLLAVIHVGLTLVWFTMLIAATAPIGHLLRQKHVLRAIDRIAGGVFIAFGARLAFSR